MKDNVSQLYVFFGLIASGKSTLAEAFAVRHDFTYYNTDRVRKDLAGMSPEERGGDNYGGGIYSKEFTLRTYRSMLTSAETDLQSGYGVVLDGSYTDKDQRSFVKDLAVRVKCNVVFIYCHCSEEETKRRLELRANDPHAVSDGRWEIFVKQRDNFVYPDEFGSKEFFDINTASSVDKLLSQLDREILENQ